MIVGTHFYILKIKKELLNEKKTNMERKIYLTEIQLRELISHIILNENVYVNDVKNGKANLTYTKGSVRNKNTQNSQDYLKTDKMDQNNADTYEVKLKGGLTCYNITSIKGSEVMHYFKRLWDNKSTKMKFKNILTNQEEEYELTMLENEEKNFIETFKSKVGTVVNYCVNNFKNSDENFSINGISIYPVPSSSNFNVKMAEILNEQGLYQYPVQVINERLLLKNLENVERDEEFIERNKDIYNAPFYAKDTNDKTTLNMHLDKNLNQLRGISNAQKKISEINEITKKLITQLANYHTSIKNSDRNTNRMISSIVENYKKYYDLLSSLTKLSTYYNPLTGNNSSTRFDNIANMIKYSKGPSIEKRSGELWNIVSKHLRGVKSPVTGSPYKWIDLAYYSPAKFQIKNFTNGERMGLKNIYTLNNNEKDKEMVQMELEKIKGTVFVIFDDNVSGGATLSDICYQCTNAGIKNIIPITFGEMNEKWTLNMRPLTTPEMENGHSKWKN